MVAASMWIKQWLMQLTCIIVSLLCFASASSLVCPPQTKPLLLTTNPSHYCSVSITTTSPLLKVTAESLERALTSRRGDAYTSVLFYASWCPFSQKARKIFEVLSSMYPQIEHLAVEQSSVMPSLFSRYGVHSVPAIFMVNQTSTSRFHGSKDLSTYIKFYENTTGYQPLHFVTSGDLGSLESSGGFILQSWIGLPATAILTREPYLALSLLFVCLRLVITISPGVLNYFKALRISYGPHLKLHIFGETSQILGRALDLIDVKRIWTKLNLFKRRNFHQGTRNARVWASSLASVSLGKTTTARSSSSGKAF